MDNPLVRCPYNKSHFVQRSRIQTHLLKCEKNYPPLEICPYNHSHRFSKEEFHEHVSSCPSKPVVWLCKDEKAKQVVLRNPKPSPEHVMKPGDPDYENWDDFYPNPQQ